MSISIYFEDDSVNLLILKALNNRKLLFTIREIVIITEMKTEGRKRLIHRTGSLLHSKFCFRPNLPVKQVIHRIQHETKVEEKN